MALIRFVWTWFRKWVMQQITKHIEAHARPESGPIFFFNVNITPKRNSFSSEGLLRLEAGGSQTVCATPKITDESHTSSINNTLIHGTQITSSRRDHDACALFDATRTRCFVPNQNKNKTDISSQDAISQNPSPYHTKNG